MSVLHIHGIARECGPERLTDVKALFAEEIICLKIFELGCCEDGGFELGGYSGWYLYSRARVKHKVGFRVLRTMHSFLSMDSPSQHLRLILVTHEPIQVIGLAHLS